MSPDLVSSPLIAIFSKASNCLRIVNPDSYSVVCSNITTAYAVVMLEQTTEYESGFTIRKQFDALENIAIKGEETKSGDIVLQLSLFSLNSNIF